jgi:hypothetical protein
MEGGLAIEGHNIQYFSELLKRLTISLGLAAFLGRRINTSHFFESRPRSP